MYDIFAVGFIFRVIMLGEMTMVFLRGIVSVPYQAIICNDVTVSTTIGINVFLHEIPKTIIMLRHGIHIYISIYYAVSCKSMLNGN